MEASDICRGELEVVIPWEEVQSESEKVLKSFRHQVRIPGFRPGKAPDSVIRTRYAQELRSEVIEKLIDRHFWKEAKEQDFNVIGTPKIRDIEFADEQPFTFKAEFEILPDFELSDYKRLQVPFLEPEVTDEEVDSEIDRLRDQHASFKNLDPRPLEDGDTAVLSLRSDEVEGAPAINQEETTLNIGAEETFEEFTKALRGKSPGEKADFDVTYPEDFGNTDLAGKTIPFHAEIKGIRVKELPEPDDDFAADVGDFQTMDELKKRIREEIGEQKRRQAVEKAKDKIVDLLVDKHDFPVPDLLVNQQVRTRLERTARMFAQQGVDLETMDLDWNRLGEEQRPRAIRDVKAGLILERISEVEAIEVEAAAIDAEVQRFAQQSQTTLAAARKQLSEDGTLDRIESHLANEKVMDFLFDESEKIDPPAEEPKLEDETESEDSETTVEAAPAEASATPEKSAE